MNCWAFGHPEEFGLLELVVLPTSCPLRKTPGIMQERKWKWSLSEGIIRMSSMRRHRRDLCNWTQRRNTHKNDGNRYMDVSRLLLRVRPIELAGVLKGI